MNPVLQECAEKLEDFIVGRREEIAMAERMLDGLRYGPGPEQGDLFDEPALRLVEGCGA